MDPMVVDMLGCLDGGQCSDKTLLAGAVGGEAGYRWRSKWRWRPLCF